MANISDYPFPQRPLDGSEVMAGWQDGKQVAVPTQTLAVLAADLAASTVEAEIAQVIQETTDAADDARQAVIDAGKVVDALSADAVEAVGRPAGVALTTGEAALSAQAFFLDRVAHSGKLTAIEIFDRAAGTLEVAVFRGSGATLARVALTTVQSQGGGLQRRLTLAAPLTVQPGDVLAMRSQADGLYTFLIPAAADGAGYYLGPQQPMPETVTLGATTTNLTLVVRFVVVYREQVVTKENFDAVTDQIERLYGDEAALIGRPEGAPIDAAEEAQPGQCFFMDQVAKDGHFAAIDVYDRAPGTIEVAAFRMIGGTWSRIGLSSVTTQGGGVVRTLPVAAPIAVLAGDMLCIRATDVGLFSVKGNAPADGAGCYLGPTEPIPATVQLGAARTDVLIHVRLRVVSREMVVTAERFAALRDELATAPRGGSARVPLAAEVRVPLLGTASWYGLVGYGQSNSTAYEAKPVLSTVQPYANRTFGGGVHTGKAGNGYGAVVTAPGMTTSKPLVEQETSEGSPGADGSAMNGETPYTAAGSTFVEMAAAKLGIDPKSVVVFASSAGHAGYSIAQLSKGSPWYQSVIDHIAGAAALAAAAGKDYVPPVIYWNQGGDDAKVGNTTAYYLAAFLKLVEDINADGRAAIIAAAPGRAAPSTPIHFVLAQIASPYFESTRANLNRIQQAQYLAAAQSPLVHYIAAEFSFDPVPAGQHLSNVSHRRMGAYIGRAMSDLIVDRCVPDCLWPVSAVASGTLLRVRYRVPTLPIVIDENAFGALPDKGFVVRDGTGVVPIVSVAVTKAGDVIEIVLGRVPGDGAVVRQGMDYIGAPNRHLMSSSTCLRDSTTAVSQGQPLWHVAPACEMPVVTLVSDPIDSDRAAPAVDAPSQAQLQALADRTVHVDAEQALSDAQRQRVRKNILALGTGAPGGTPLEHYLTTADGEPADWGPIIQRAILGLGGRRLQLERGRVYPVAAPIQIATDIALDLNEAVIIAPKGFLSARGDRVAYQGGALFDVVEGRSFFTPHAALRTAIVAGTVRRGDVLQFESDTVRLATGSYLFGQIARFVRYVPGDDRVYIDRAFYAGFRVDRLRVRLPLNIGVANGTLDLSGAQQVSAGNPAIGITASGDNVRYEAIKAIGGDYAGQGLAGEGMRTVMIDCRADGFLDKGGIPGGGRLGYGFAGSGDEWTLERCSASACKHGVSASARHYQTREVRVIDFTGHVPADAMATTIQTQGGPVEAAYQAQLDCHANTSFFKAIRPAIDGPNALIAIRNGHAFVDGPILRSRGMNPSSQTPHIITVYEEAVRDVLVRDALVRADAQNGVLPYFIGIDGFGFANRRLTVHGLEVSPAGSSDIGLCNIRGNADAGTAAQISVDMIDFRRVRGRIADGIVVGGNAALAGIGAIQIDADVVMDDKPGLYHQAILRVAGRVGYLNALTIDGKIDASACTSADGPGIVEIGDGNSPIVLPKTVTMPATITCPYAAFFAASNNSAEAARIGHWAFDRSHVSYGNVQRPGGADQYGIYVSTPLVPSVPTTFAGAVIVVGSYGGQIIRFPLRGAPKLDGLTTNGEYYFNGDPSSLPVGYRRINGLNSRWTANFDVDAVGNVYCRFTTPPTGTNGAFPNGAVIRAPSVAAGQSPGWVNVGPTGGALSWRALPAVAA